MEITITNCQFAPKWESLEQIIKEATNKPQGRLVRISRQDNGCNYRAPGTYSLGFRQSNSDMNILSITLNVVATAARRPLSLH